MKQFPDKIAILGVGLIGGSIALGLKRHFGAKITILGMCSSLKRAQTAQKEGIIDKAIAGCEDIPQNTKLIIISTPIKTILEKLHLLAKLHLRNCLIIDTGSTKEVISQSAKRESLSSSFIGTHPMAGSEMSGFENSSVNLFRNKPWIICPFGTVNKNNLEIVNKLIFILGAKPFLLDAKTHDFVVTWGSHIFLLMTSILVNTIKKQKNWQTIAKAASTGFRDTTRLASDNPKMKTDIVLTNKEHLIGALVNTRSEIDHFIKLLQGSNADNIFTYFREAKLIRDNWLSNYFN